MSVSWMKTFMKTVLVMGLFVYLELFHVRYFNVDIYQTLEVPFAAHASQMPNGSVSNVIELVRKLSENPVVNPLRKTFFHFERHADMYVENWKNKMDV